MGRLFNNFSNRTWYIIAGVIVGLVILFLISSVIGTGPFSLS